MHRRSVSGSSSTPILVFLGIVGLSAVFFLIFTGRTPVTTKGPAPAVQSPAPGTTAVPGKAGPVTAKPPAPAPKKPPIAPVVYAQPEQLLAAITTELRAGDLENAMKLGGKDFAILPGTSSANVSFQVTQAGSGDQGIALVIVEFTARQADRSQCIERVIEVFASAQLGVAEAGAADDQAGRLQRPDHAQRHGQAGRLAIGQGQRRRTVSRQDKEEGFVEVLDRPRFLAGLDFEDVVEDLVGAEERGAEHGVVRRETRRSSEANDSATVMAPRKALIPLK